MTNFTSAAEKLKALLKLPRGWNYGRGRALDIKAHIFSMAALQYLNSVGANRFDILPANNGGATIIASFGDQVAEIVVGSNGLFDLFLEAEDCQEFENLKFGELISKLEEAGWQSPKSSGSQTHVFSVASTEDSPVKLSPIWVKAHLLSARHVWRPVAVPFATTWTGTTEESVESLLFSGDSPRPPLLMARG